MTLLMQLLYNKRLSWGVSNQVCFSGNHLFPQCWSTGFYLHSYTCTCMDTCTLCAQKPHLKVTSDRCFQIAVISKGIHMAKWILQFFFYAYLPPTVLPASATAPVLSSAIPTTHQIPPSPSTNHGLVAISACAKHASPVPPASSHTWPQLVLPAADDDVPALPTAVCPSTVHTDGAAGPSVPREPALFCQSRGDWTAKHCLSDSQTAS